MEHINISRFMLNILSSSQLTLTYFIIAIAIVFNNTFAIFLFFAQIVKTLILFYPKKIFKGSSLGKRPKGAYDCNLFNCGGKPYTGGIISGHMTSVTMLFTSLLLSMNVAGIFNKKLLMLGSFIIVTTGISRFLTKCHTLFQIVLGCFTGIILGFVSFKIQSLITNNRFNKDKNKVLNIFKLI